MILNFKTKFPWGADTNFVEKIDDRIKIHSIREDKTNRWKPETLIHLSTGARSKKYDCFNELECISVQSISIEYPEERSVFSFLVAERVLKIDEFLYKRVRVNIDGRFVSERIVSQLALNDGFDSIIDFFRWFNKPFTGKIIHWTDFRY